MLKSILNLGGAQLLSKNEQKEINGGFSFKLCSNGGDPECCGNLQGQCGIGINGGGLYQGDFNGRPVCNCF